MQGGDMLSCAECLRCPCPPPGRATSSPRCPLSYAVGPSAPAASPAPAAPRTMRPIVLALAVLYQCLARGDGLPVLDAPGCPEQYGVQTYSHPEACDHFFKCTNGTLTLEQCENGLLYDGKGNVHNHCNYHWGVECGNRKAVLTPESSPGCEYKFGIYPESDSCSTNYIKCEYGYPYQTPCDAGLVYDDSTHSCNWPDKLIKSCNPEAVLGFKCPDKVDPHSPQAKFWPYPRYAIPGDCDRLITCVDGHPRLITCGDGKVFDETTLSCEEPEDAHSKCGAFGKK